MLTNKPHNIFPYFPSSEPVNNLDRIPSPGRQSIPALGNHVGERRIVCDVSWREVFRLVVNPRMRGGDGRRDDAQMRMTKEEGKVVNLPLEDSAYRSLNSARA